MGQGGSLGCGAHLIGALVRRTHVGRGGLVGESSLDDSEALEGGLIGGDLDVELALACAGRVLGVRLKNGARKQGNWPVSSEGVEGRQEQVVKDWLHE